MLGRVSAGEWADDVPCLRRCCADGRRPSQGILGLSDGNTVSIVGGGGRPQFAIPTAKAPTTGCYTRFMWYVSSVISEVSDELSILNLLF